MSAAETKKRRGRKRLSVKPVFTCQHCGKGFPRNEHMLRHERKHTGEKPFSCLFDGCSRTFSRYDNLMPHFRNHYGLGRPQDIERAEVQIDLLRTHTVDELKRMSKEKRCRMLTEEDETGSRPGSAPVDPRDLLLQSPGSSYSSTSSGSVSQDEDGEEGEEDEVIEDGEENSQSLEEEDAIVDVVAAVIKARTPPARADFQTYSQPSSQPRHPTTFSLSQQQQQQQQQLFHQALLHHQQRMASFPPLFTPAQTPPPISTPPMQFVQQLQQQQHSSSFSSYQHPAPQQYSPQTPQGSLTSANPVNPRSFAPSTEKFDRDLIKKFRGPL